MAYCTICTERIETEEIFPDDCKEYPYIKTSCGHTFHKLCLHKWINKPTHKYNSCPVCRGNIDDTGHYLNEVDHNEERIWNVHVNYPYWYNEITGREFQVRRNSSSRIEDFIHYDNEIFISETSNMSLQDRIQHLSEDEDLAEIIRGSQFPITHEYLDRLEEYIF